MKTAGYLSSARLEKSASLFHVGMTSSAVDWKQKAEDNKPIPPSDVVIDTEDPGYAVYENNCASCHGENLEGGAAGPSLMGIERSAEEIADIAVNGVGDMPPGLFNGTDEELEQLANFILSVNEDSEE